MFRIPNIMGGAYLPGAQPNSPGNSHMPWDSYRTNIIPWPKIVPVINALASDPGTPRMRGGQPFINRIGTSPSDYLTIGGVVAKSGG